MAVSSKTTSPTR